MKDKIYKKEYGNKDSDHVLIYLHDFWDYHKSYFKFASFIQQYSGDRVSSILIDIPGFGLSGGTRGHLDSLDRFCYEIAKIIEENKKKKVILAGHGFGALLAMKTYLKFNHLFSTDVEGLILSNPFFSFTQSYGKGLTETAYLLNGSLGKLKVPNINASSIFTESMKIDPLNCKKISFRLFGLAHYDGAIALEWGPLLDIPTLLLIGCDTPFYSLENMRYFAGKIDQQYKTEYEFPQKSHWLFQNDETEDIMTSIGNWIRSNYKI